MKRKQVWKVMGVVLAGTLMFTDATPLLAAVPSQKTENPDIPDSKKKSEGQSEADLSGEEGTDEEAKGEEIPAIYVNLFSGNDAEDGRSEDHAVKTVKRAEEILEKWKKLQKEAEDDQNADLMNRQNGKNGETAKTSASQKENVSVKTEKKDSLPNKTAASDAGLQEKDPETEKNEEVLPEAFFVFLEMTEKQLSEYKENQQKTEKSGQEKEEISSQNIRWISEEQYQKLLSEREKQEEESSEETKKEENQQEENGEENQSDRQSESPEENQNSVPEEDSSGEDSSEEPEAGEPEQKQPETEEAEAGEPEQKQPETEEPEAGEPKQNQPEMEQPGAEQPEAEEKNRGKQEEPSKNPGNSVEIPENAAEKPEEQVEQMEGMEENSHQEEETDEEKASKLAASSLTSYEGSLLRPMMAVKSLRFGLLSIEDTEDTLLSEEDDLLAASGKPAEASAEEMTAKAEAAAAGTEAEETVVPLKAARLGGVILVGPDNYGSNQTKKPSDSQTSSNKETVSSGKPSGSTGGGIKESSSKAASVSSKQTVSNSQKPAQILSSLKSLPVKTGDESRVLVFSASAMLSAGLMALLTFLRMKEKRTRSLVAWQEFKKEHPLSED